MTYRVAIRKNETGEVRFYQDPSEWTESDYFYWTDGNAGCDCNRELFFERAAGNEINLDAVKCSDDRFSCLYAELPDGRRIELGTLSED